LILAAAHRAETAAETAKPALEETVKPALEEKAKPAPEEIALQQGCREELQ
jgi:hypothetical protein